MPATPPAATPRQTPGGKRLKDGFSSLITFALDPDIQLYEISVKPSGMDGGEKINTTTMHNVHRRTYAPRALIDYTDASMTCAYDPKVRDALRQALNRPDTITQEWSDGSTEADYGWLRSAEFNELKEGEMPTVNIMITYSGTDAAGTEADPVLVEVAGT